MGKAIMRKKLTMSLNSKRILMHRRNLSRYLTATRMERPSTGYMKKPLNGNEDVNFTPFTVYADY